jgi:hypothetical protein
MPVGNNSMVAKLGLRLRELSLVRPLPLNPNSERTCNAPTLTQALRTR